MSAPAMLRMGSSGERIAARLAELAKLTDEPGVITRLYLSPAHRRAADLVSSWMREAGMTVRMDLLSAIAGRHEERTPSYAPCSLSPPATDIASKEPTWPGSRS